MNVLSVSNRQPQRGPPELAYGGILRAFGAIQRVMRPYFLQYGLTQSQWAILRLLYRVEHNGRPEGLRMVEIGQRILVQPPSVTTLVRRLTKAGLTVHAPAPNDRRGVHLRLTARGNALVERVLLGHRRQIRKVAGGLGARDLRRFCDLLERFNDHVTSLLAQPPEPGH
jgi:MarR family 2-MHQ and catechol resistance regulon transcriptional repressor